jgi:hypothetical protein
VNLTQSHPTRNVGVLLRQEGERGMAIDPSSDVVHIMNATAVAIWTLCDGETTPEEMVVAVCDLSKLPREVVEEDVLGILREFERKGLISWGDA